MRNRLLTLSSLIFSRLIRLPVTQFSVTLLSATVLSGCLEAGGHGHDYGTVPDVEIQCSNIVCPTSPATVFLGFLKQTGIDCEAYLEQILPAQYYQSFDAWGETTVTLSGPILNGFVTSWFDSQSAAIGEIENLEFKVCGHYDADNDQVLDAGEAVGELTNVYPGTGPYIISDWFNY